MKIHYILLGLIVTAIILLVIPMFGKSKEGFNDIGYATIVDPTRSDYIEISKKKYNLMADTVDILGPGIFGMAASTEQRIALNNEITSALSTTNYQPTSTNKHTGMELTVTSPKIAVPTQGTIVEKIKKCENQKGRSKCAILGNSEYNECGVCITAGSAVFSENNANHIGGMFMTEKAKNRAAAYSGPNANRDNVAAYMKPSAGSCPEGSFFIDKDDCETAVRIQNCKEIKGGFMVGRTAEGLTATAADCAQCGTETDVFVYQPHANASSSPRLRVLAPTGTGITAVIVNKNVSNVTTQVGFGYTNRINGTEFTVDIEDSINEGQELEIRVIQQFPTRPGGLREVFYVDLGSTALSTSLYNSRQAAGLNPLTETFATAADAQILCESMGCRLANFSELQDAYNNNLQNCNFGWISDRPMPYRSGQANIDTVSPRCFATFGLVQATATQQSAGAWCFGIKPEAGRYQYGYSPQNFSWDVVVAPFFTSFGAESTPSQANSPTINSRHIIGGSNYIAPNQRAVIIQWESRDFDTTKPLQRVIYALYPTISKINGYTLTNEVATRIMRNFGTFASSQIITSPSASTLVTTPILRKSFWFWSNERVNNSMTLSAKVPGLLKKTIYPADQVRCEGKPLITNINTLNAITVSACDASPATQGPGSFTNSCLVELFRNAGGTPAGELFPNTPAKANTIMTKTDGANRTKDEIMNYLFNRFTIATTGRDLLGAIQMDNSGSTNADNIRKAINKAAKDMFGIEIVTACETVFVNSQGQVSIAPKAGPFDQDCLTLLYNNAGYETSRQEESLNTSNTNPIKPTYTTVSAVATDMIRASMANAYSGLKKSDMASATDKLANPFKTCQPSGLVNPSHSNTTVRNEAILAANSSGITMRQIQDFYNTIYNNANTSYTADNSNSDTITNQKEAFEKCYGISKFDETTLPTGCSQKVQYIRILRSVNGQYDYFVWKWYKKSSFSRPITDTVQNPNLNISQVMAYDPRGDNVARNKTASFYSIKQGSSALAPLDGNVSSRGDVGTYKDNGINNNSVNEYYMVDLRTPQEVRSVEVTFGNDEDRVKYFGVCVQLLDKDMKVVTQKVIDKKMIDNYQPSRKVLLTFSRDDLLEEMPISKLVNNVEVRIENLGWTTWIFNKPRPGNLGDFKLRNIVEGLTIKPGAWALGSGDRFLCCHKNNQNTEYRTREECRQGPFNYSFYIRPAINGCRNAITIESADLPGRYLRVDFERPWNSKLEQISPNASEWEKCTVSLLRLRKPNSNIII